MKYVVIFTTAKQLCVFNGGALGFGVPRFITIHPGTRETLWSLKHQGEITGVFYTLMLKGSIDKP